MGGFGIRILGGFPDYFSDGSVIYQHTFELSIILGSVGSPQIRTEIRIESIDLQRHTNGFMEQNFLQRFSFSFFLLLVQTIGCLMASIPYLVVRVNRLTWFHDEIKNFILCSTLSEITPYECLMLSLFCYVTLIQRFTRLMTHIVNCLRS